MRGFFSTLITILIGGAIGFGVGVYVTPPDKAAQFHSLVNEKLDQMNEALHSIKAGKQETPPAEQPQAAAPAEPGPVKEAAPGQPPQNQSGAAAPCDPSDPKCAGETSSEAAAPAPVEAPSQAVAEPPAAPSENKASEAAPATDAAPTAAVPQPTAVPAQPAAKPAMAKTAAKPPVKKPKPKPKPAPAQMDPVDQPPN